MLSSRLVQMIEDHAGQLTSGLVHKLKSHTQTPHYHKLSGDELHRRIYEVYRNLGEWLTHNANEAAEATYRELGKTRYAEGIPLGEVVYALILTKYHLRDYIRYAGLLDSAIELYQEQELHRLLGQFFDKAIYCAVCGYEAQAASQHGAARDRSARARPPSNAVQQALPQHERSLGD